MSEIQQIYCTHCTYGSSALERSEGELASRVLEYGPRASSLSAGKLREYYRQIEPLLYYALPADMPAAEKLAATADSAPRRLFYCPSIENLQVLGQVCFRPKDTMGRHGSYFAHLLVGEPPQARWPVPQCAQAWGAAAWVREDSANHLHDLPRLADLASFCGTPVLGDPLLLGFLTEPKGSRFFDQQELIAPRWKLKDPAVRQRLLVDLLAAYLDIAASPSRRESAIVVVEPEVAALLFYGVARLLPEGPIRQNISFSTFEPHADRLTAVALAATTFHQPQTSDLAPEFYQGQNFVFNTFLGRSSSRRPSGTHYASLVVQDFMAGKDAGAGPNGVGELLRSFQAVQPASPHELALLAQAHALVPGLLDPKRPLPKELWQEESKARDYLALAAARQLGRLPVHSPDLRALVGTARQMELLRLVSRLPDADPQRGGVRLLLWSLPEPWFGALVGSAQVRPDFKLEALLHFVAQEKALPKEWDMVPRAGGQKARLTADSVKDLLMQLLGRLDPSLVPGVLRGLSPEQFGALMGDVLQSGPPDQKKNDMLLFLEQLPDDDLVTVLARLGERVFLAYPRERTVLRERLQSLLDDLHSHPADFDRRLDVLWKCKEHFPNPGAAEEQMDHWRKVREKLLEIRGHLQRQGSLSVTALLGSEAVDFSQIGETLAKELGFAIPDDRVPPSPEDSRAEFLARYKLECLRDIGEVMVGTPGFLPDDVFQDIFNAFKGIAWPSKQLSKARKGSAIGRLGGRSRNVGRPRRRTPTWLKTFSIFLAPFLLVGGAIVLVAVVNPFGADSRFAHLRQSVEHAGSTPAPDPLAEKVPGAKPPPSPGLGEPTW